jgi:UDP-sugar transporter A1/2/3
MPQYTGAEFKDLPKPSGPGTAAKIGLFCFFVMTRAIHPTIIDASKTMDEETGKRGLAYGKMTVVIAESFFTLIAGQLLALALGGMKEWRMIWEPKALKVFSAIGFMYALGDYLEMASMGALGGAAYQVLLQSKLLITALMLWGIKGSKQAMIQWNLLLVIMLSMCVYMIGGKSDSGSSGGIPIMGVFNVLLKVTVSCLCAVMADKYMKDFKNLPFYVQMVQLKISWTITILIIAFADGKTFQDGFFTGWTPVVAGVFGSFVVKCWSTMAILSLLDSVLKNIGEASAVLVIYFMQVLLPIFPDKFEIPSFLSVMVVILSVTAYVGTKSVVEKAALWDAKQKQ